MTTLISNNPFRSTRATFWLIGVALLVLGVLLGAVVLPTSAPTRGSEGPDIRVPAMQNVPAEPAPKMKLDVEKRR